MEKNYNRNNKNIGTGSSYNKRKTFDKLLMNKDNISRGIIKNNITKLHIVEENKNQIFWVDAIFY